MKGDNEGADMTEISRREGELGRMRNGGGTSERK